MRFFKLLLVLALGAALLSPDPASAQTRSEYQQWVGLLGNGTLDRENPKLMFWFDGHARRGDGGTVVILRPGVGLRLKDWVTLWAGYAWVPVFDDASGSSTNEHRIWEQVTLTHKFPAGVSAQSRTRFEQRFSDAGDDLGFRLRQFVRVNWQPREDFPMGAAFWDELFIGLNDTDWGPSTGFDQNRIFFGPFVRLAPWARLEMGYLYVFLNRPTDVSAHVLAVNLFVALKPGDDAK